MQDIFKDFDETNNKNILKKLYSHSLGLGELVGYNNSLVDINGNFIGRLFYINTAENKMMPWATRKHSQFFGEIYKIENLVAHKIYIGQSKDLVARKNKHSYDLYSGNHGSSDMQMDFYLYKMKSFIYEILEQVPHGTKLVDREKYWINKYNSEFPNGYNSPSKRKDPEYRNRISLFFLEEYNHIAKTQQQKDFLIKLMLDKKYKPQYDDYYGVDISPIYQGKNFLVDAKNNGELC